MRGTHAAVLYPVIARRKRSRYVIARRKRSSQPAKSMAGWDALADMFQLGTVPVKIDHAAASGLHDNGEAGEAWRDDGGDDWESVVGRTREEHPDLQRFLDAHGNLKM